MSEEICCSWGGFEAAVPPQLLLVPAGALCSSQDRNEAVEAAHRAARCRRCRGKGRGLRQRGPSARLQPHSPDPCSYFPVSEHTRCFNPLLALRITHTLRTVTSKMQLTADELICVFIKMPFKIAHHISFPLKGARK